MPAGLREHVRGGLSDDMRGYSCARMRESRGTTGRAWIHSCRRTDHEAISQIRRALGAVAEGPAGGNVRQKAGPHPDEACRDRRPARVRVDLRSVMEFLPGKTQDRHRVDPLTGPGTSESASLIER